MSVLATSATWTGKLSSFALTVCRSSLVHFWEFVIPSTSWSLEVNLRNPPIRESSRRRLSFSFVIRFTSFFEFLFTYFASSNSDWSKSIWFWSDEFCLVKSFTHVCNSPIFFFSASLVGLSEGLGELVAVGVTPQVASNSVRLWLNIFKWDSRDCSVVEVAFDCELPFVFFLFVFFSRAFCFFSVPLSLTVWTFFGIDPLTSALSYQ